MPGRLVYTWYYELFKKKMSGTCTHGGGGDSYTSHFLLSSKQHRRSKKQNMLNDIYCINSEFIYPLKGQSNLYLPAHSGGYPPAIYLPTSTRPQTC